MNTINNNIPVVTFEPWWITSLADMLLGKLEDRDLTPEDLALSSGVSLADIRAFLSHDLRDLTPLQYLQIETALGLPENYFSRLKTMYSERASKLIPD